MSSSITKEPELVDKFKEELKEEFSKKQNDFKVDNSEEASGKKAIAEKVIDNANKYFLIEILSPEITNNEEKKREHKDNL